MDAMTVGTFLGGMNFTSCDALAAGGASATGSGMPSTYTGAAVGKKVVGGVGALVVGLGVLGGWVL